MKNHITAWLLLAAAPALFAAEAPDFNRDVRPILSDKCFACHGHDEHARKAKLRLDNYRDATTPRDGVSAIDPKQLAKSELIKRILDTDPDEVMPPPKSKKRLSAGQIDILKRWVESGAEYQDHWAFVAPTKREVPKGPGVKGGNPVDHFIAHRAAKAGLALSAEAEKHTLLRRVTLDLTGLPPTLQELRAFIKDPSPKAYENAVDRLLASPQFGERMAVAWMDAARYGDSSVMHADGPRIMWPWRDWVIRAYNKNMPFDRFTVEQLAGDLLPDATPGQKLATGFNRNHATSDEGGAFPEELRVEYIVDRVKTTANVFLGLSMECGQCHDHKFDPITQQEYYRFYAYFNNNKDPGMQTRNGNQAPVVDVVDPDREEKLLVIRDERKALDAQVEARRKQAGDALVLWTAKKASEFEKGEAKPLPGGLALHIALDEPAGKEFADLAGGHTGTLHGTLKPVARDGSGALELDGKTVVDFPGAATFLEFNKPMTLAAWVKAPGNAGGAVFSRMKDSQAYRGFDLYMQAGSIGVHIVSKWQDNAIKVVSQPKLRADQWEHVAVSYDGSGKAAGVSIYINGAKVGTATEADGLSGTIKNDAPFRIGKRTDGSPWRGSVDDIRIYERALELEEVMSLKDAGAGLRELFATPADKLTDGQRTTLTNLYLKDNDPEYKTLQAKRSDLDRRENELNKTGKKVNSMIMGDNDKPRMTYVLNRGAYDSPIKESEIKPGTPAFLPPMPENAEPNRLGMAKWLVNSNHPLTARVAVNRYWSMLFGTGIVPTVMDFGNQGAPPSHPELLDWLAVDFMESGWDIKRIIKRIVTSHTYRQSARQTPELKQADPRNTLLARSPRFRLQGEFIRDNALAVSGLLNPMIGGESVKPYQPPNIWNEVSLNGGLRYKQDSGDKLYRRSMYTYWKRSAPAPNMMIFDAPTREKCMVQRARTNTPLQALVTLNDMHFVEASRKLAERMMKEGADFEKRIAYAYLLCAARMADPDELAICREVFDRQLASFRANPEAAKKYLGIGASPRDEALDPNELAAWTVIANMILNLDEVLTRG